MAVPVRTCIGCRQRDTATEMVTIMSAMRAYEANVAAASAARALALKTLEIGGNS